MNTQVIESAWRRWRKPKRYFGTFFEVVKAWECGREPYPAVRKAGGTK